MPDPATHDTAPLTPEDARPLFAPLALAHAVLLAVSGGPDSIALLRLAVAVAATDPAFPAIAVATVDHGLRPASRREAEAVAASARSLGLPAHILTWEGTKPANRLQERARHHRYALLTACAGRIGATHLVTAHTRDDQAETVLFRLMRGSGVAGLAGMRPAVTRDGVVHLRPFLDIPKARLVAACRRNGWEVVSDPANADPRFARTRLRALLPLLAAEGLDAARFTTLARRMAEAEAALAAAARRAVAEARRPEGALDARRLCSEPAAVRCRILDLLLTDLAAAAGRPRLENVERLSDALAEAVVHGRPLRRTLHGAVIGFDGRDRLTVAPHPPRRAVAGDASPADPCP